MNKSILELCGIVSEIILISYLCFAILVLLATFSGGVELLEYHRFFTARERVAFYTVFLFAPFLPIIMTYAFYVNYQVVISKRQEKEPVFTKKVKLIIITTPLVLLIKLLLAISQT